MQEGERERKKSQPGLPSKFLFTSPDNKSQQAMEIWMASVYTVAADTLKRGVF